MRKPMRELLVSNPDEFIRAWKQVQNPYSKEVAELLDANDSLSYTRKWFRIEDSIPFAGHSLGPAFAP